MADLYRPGDYRVICDRCGRKRYASETRKEWNGLLVCREHFEARHPQDFVRGRADDQTVSDPRPRPDDRFLDSNEVQPEDL
jgi:hypothetical protein